MGQTLREIKSADSSELYEGKRGEGDEKVGGKVYWHLGEDYESKAIVQEEAIQPETGKGSRKYAIRSEPSLMVHFSPGGGWDSKTKVGDCVSFSKLDSPSWVSEKESYVSPNKSKNHILPIRWNYPEVTESSILEEDSASMERINEIASLKGEGLPSEDALRTAMGVLRILKSIGISVSMINPTYEDSLIIECVDNDLYRSVEIYNDLEIILMIDEDEGDTILKSVEGGQLRKVIGFFSDVR